MPTGLRAEEVRALYERFAPVVHRRALAFLGGEADAWDVVQEVFERMVKAGDAFRGESRPMTWVYRITTNVCLNLLRARGLRERPLHAREVGAGELGAADPLDAATADEPGANGRSPADQFEARELLEKLHRSLDEREVAIAALLFVDGLTQEEIAEVLGLSRKTIGRELEEIRRKASALVELPHG